MILIGRGLDQEKNERVCLKESEEEEDIEDVSY